MHKKFSVFILSLLIIPCTMSSAQEQIQALILTGQSNKYHNWKAMSTVLKNHLDAAGIFETDVLVSPAIGEDFSSFNPQWDWYDVVLLDYDGDDWPKSVQESFEAYIRKGGGLVLVHASNNAFPFWDAYQDIIGIGGWGGAQLYDPPLKRAPGEQGGRNEDWGPRVYWHNGQMVRDPSPGGAYHPPRHDFLITVRDHDHPVTQGLPETWLHCNDECYSGLRGPAKHLDILATGFANPAMERASPYHEPILFTVGYGEGRIFQTTLGHIGPKQWIDAPSVNNVGFILTVQRAAEWAATGKVSIAVPDDFPNAYKGSLRPSTGDE